MWEVGAFITVVLVVDLSLMGIYKVLRRTAHGKQLNEEA
jgi:hypothetical protein